MNLVLNALGKPAAAHASVHRLSDGSRTLTLDEHHRDQFEKVIRDPVGQLLAPGRRVRVPPPPSSTAHERRPGVATYDSADGRLGAGHWGDAGPVQRNLWITQRYY
jgi:hypothetical protein